MERLVTEIFVVNEEFTTGSGAPRGRVYTMLNGLFDSSDRYRHVFSAMLEARGSSATVRQIWDDARDAFTPSVAELIRAQRPGDVPHPRSLPRCCWSSTTGCWSGSSSAVSSRAQLIEGAAAVWLSTIYGEYR